MIGGTTVIPATSFTNDSGGTVAAGGLVVASSNGYYNLFQNNVLQRGATSTLSAANLTINSALIVGVTIVVEVVNFSSTSTSTSTNNFAITTSIKS
ncbi:DUF4183 domain-containing protein [Paenibacillus anaericanus]|uniref:DUF4183 domain-containing protein n=1 Tax=Paenibacillus anaericanus TaxID=170367 RepID=UPI00319EAA8C